MASIHAHHSDTEQWDEGYNCDESDGWFDATSEESAKPGTDFLMVYIWVPLLKSQDIRLIELHPASDAGEPIKIDMRVFSLIDPPSYHTLSYAWGPKSHDTSNLSHKIRCRGHDIPVTTHLWNELRRIRETESPRMLKTGDRSLLWIDALCINQADYCERNSQVALMDHIYRTAERTIVWLGEQHPIHGYSILLHYVEQMETRLSKEHLLGLPYMGRNMKTIVADQVRDLLQCSWFFRRWTLQEFALSDRVRFQVGSHRIWPLNFITVSRALGIDMPPILEDRQPEATLLRNLMEFSNTLCSEPHDYIFALLAMSCDRNLFKVDYSQPYELLCRRVVEQYLPHTVPELQYDHRGFLRSQCQDFYELPSRGVPMTQRLQKPMFILSKSRPIGGRSEIPVLLQMPGPGPETPHPPGKLSLSTTRFPSPSSQHSLSPDQSETQQIDDTTVRTDVVAKIKGKSSNCLRTLVDILMFAVRSRDVPDKKYVHMPSWVPNWAAIAQAEQGKLGPEASSPRYAAESIQFAQVYNGNQGFHGDILLCQGIMVDDKDDKIENGISRTMRRLEQDRKRALKDVYEIYSPAETEYRRRKINTKYTRASETIFSLRELFLGLSASYRGSKAHRAFMILGCNVIWALKPMYEEENWWPEQRLGRYKLISYDVTCTSVDWALIENLILEVQELEQHLSGLTRPPAVRSQKLPWLVSGQSTRPSHWRTIEIV